MSNETEPSLPLDIPEQPEVVTGQKIGYARVSSKDQNLDRQLAALKKEKVFRVFTDTVSGSSTQRPGLDGALNYVRAGDQLIVVSMDRLARSLIDLHRLVDELTERGVSVKFLKEGQVYSQDSTPVAKLMLGCSGLWRSLNVRLFASARPKVLPKPRRAVSIRGVRKSSTRNK